MPSPEMMARMAPSEPAAPPAGEPVIGNAVTPGRAADDRTGCSIIRPATLDCGSVRVNEASLLMPATPDCGPGMNGCPMLAVGCCANGAVYEAIPPNAAT